MIKIVDQDDKVVYVDRKMVNKFNLHKLLENGGTIKFNNLGVFSVSHDPNKPNNMFIEVKLGFVKIDEKFKGHVNPTASKTVFKKPEKAKFELEEDDEEVL